MRCFIFVVVLSVVAASAVAMPRPLVTRPPSATIEVKQQRMTLQQIAQASKGKQLRMIYSSKPILR